MMIHSMPVGPLQANCYIVGCEKTHKAVVIDPGGEADRILNALAENKLTLTAIINTHGHFDHVGANKPLKEATRAMLMIHKLDTPMLDNIMGSASAWGLKVEPSPKADRFLEEGDVIECGGLHLKVLHTPGHTPGGISLYTQKAVFVGDTLFSGSIGRTDFPGGDYDALISSIQDKLFTLPDDTPVYTGHMESTTIGKEKKCNPFCGIG